MSRLKRFVGDRGGTAALEFALIGLPLIMLLLGLIEFGRGLHIRAGLDSAADRAQRMILIDPAAGKAAIETEIRRSFVAGNASLLTVNVTEPVPGADYRTLTLGYPMQLIMPAPIGGTISIGATRRVVSVP